MSRRVHRVNRLIKEELGKIIHREITFPQGVLVTIIEAETSVDLEQVRVKVSVLPEKKQKEVLNILQKNIGYLQRLLNKKLIMRYVPKIKFEIDKRQERVKRIEELLREI